MARQRELILVVLFGSQATGKTHSHSDVDIGFVAPKRLGLREVAELEMEMTETLGQSRLELVDLKNTPPLLNKKVADEGILLYENESGSFADFRAYAFKMYVEAKPLFRLRENYLHQFIVRHA